MSGADVRMFFVVGHGRSGTKFLAELLGRAEGAQIYHEPYPYDRYLLPYAYYFPESTVLKGMLEQRFSVMLAAHPRETVYGEVNSLLRYHVEYIRQKYKATIIHLVRNGRDVVRSTFVRPTYTSDDSHLPIVPKNEDPFSSNWVQSTRLEKICWYWNETVTNLQRTVKRTIRLEDILEDYDSFCRGVLDPLGLNVPEDVWRQATKRPTNKTGTPVTERLRSVWYGLRGRERPQSKFRFPGWDRQSSAVFDRICGEAMRTFGYE